MTTLAPTAKHPTGYVGVVQCVRTLATALVTKATTTKG
jgi:hypothetical protein